MGERLQTTLKNRISCTGIGLHSGKTISMTLCPAEADTGIYFRRLDVSEGRQMVPAHFDAVCHTKLGTTVRNAHGVEVATIEHLMAALAGCEIDNAIVELDGHEIPVMDGSAAPFVFLIECADSRELPVPRKAIEILKTVRVEENGAVAQLSPAEGLELALDIDFESGAINRQNFELLWSADAFKFELSRARTFGFLEQVEFLRQNGRALGGSLDNSIVIDGDVILNRGGLRYQNEFVRHKLLDTVGDLYTAGAPIIGRFEGRRSGHGLNNALLRALFENSDAWRIVTEPAVETIIRDGNYSEPIAINA